MMGAIVLALLAGTVIGLVTLLFLSVVAHEVFGV